MCTPLLIGCPSKDIELTCFTYDGIDGIIAALKTGEECSTEDIQIKVGPGMADRAVAGGGGGGGGSRVLTLALLHARCAWLGGAQIKLVAAPLYVMTAQSLEKQKGIDLMEAALAKMTEVIKSKGGDIAIKMKVMRWPCEARAGEPRTERLTVACMRALLGDPSQPRAVSEADDKELQDLMTKAEQETAQVAGDEPEDDD